jgi:hypothetical protein
MRSNVRSAPRYLGGYFGCLYSGPWHFYSILFGFALERVGMRRYSCAKPAHCALSFMRALYHGFLRHLRCGQIECEMGRHHTTWDDTSGHFSVKNPLDGFFFYEGSGGEIDEGKGRSRCGMADNGLMTHLRLPSA